MRVHLTPILHEYTRGRTVVDAEGDSLAAALADLDRRFPGMRFRVVDEQGRIRPHMRCFVAGEMAQVLDVPVPPGAEIHILGALSGG